MAVPQGTDEAITAGSSGAKDPIPATESKNSWTSFWRTDSLLRFSGRDGGGEATWRGPEQSEMTGSGRVGNFLVKPVLWFRYTGALNAKRIVPVICWRRKTFSREVNVAPNSAMDYGGGAFVKRHASGRPAPAQEEESK